MKRMEVAHARTRVVLAALKKQSLTNSAACLIGGWEQGWFHLAHLQALGLLVKDGHNTWLPGPRAKQLKARPQRLLKIIAGGNKRAA